MRKIEELAEQVRRVVGLRTARRELDEALGARHFHRAVTQAHQFELQLQRFAALIDQMKVEAIQAFVGHHELQRLQRLREGMPGALGPSCCIDDTPARAWPQVLELPDERTGARRTMTAPLREHVAHQLGNDRA
ncbi:sugar dehydrogenase complex small subunit [Paraburkholderia sp. DHOC27]|uniref:sugar dehydrogenase complex small subunit n=1 Tax=Paraburkholderia sp. DHOC27 TaxID=2303330 RepID=UPI000E3C3AE6|nr:hypothetical protein D0B32_10305 [Paraburkholderia sp. DHOC27]